MEKQIETEELFCPDLDDFPPEPKTIFFGIGPWKASYTGTDMPSFKEKLDMWILSYRRDMFRGLIVFFALGVMWWTGHNAARVDFERAIRAGLYVENATMVEQLEKSAPWIRSGTGEERR